MQVTTLIVDDEPLARRTMRELLSPVPWVLCIGEAADGVTAVRRIDGARPELVFLDVKMPGMSGIEVLRQVTHRPAVIFTTAFDEYAVAAFELRALDYLLKPFGRRRLEQALERVRDVLRGGSTADPFERAEEALDEHLPLRRLYVRERGEIVPVPVHKIERLEARRDYVGLWVEGRRFLINLPMQELERRLDPSRFVRIHRSHMVNLDYVAAVVPQANSRLEVRMRDGTMVMASRGRSPGLREGLRAR